MEYGILGPLRVCADDGGELALGGARRQALLALLLLQPNRAVSADALVEGLWEGDPPASAVATLQSHVSHLRRALGHDRIETAGSSYRLRVEPEELDAAAFERELADGRALLTTGDVGGAERLLTTALGRWRGPVLGDLGSASWATAAAARLDELRLVATEWLLEVRLAGGRNPEVIAAAEAAIAEHPLRERLWANLLVALYRDGRQADALRAYQRLRSALADELGIDPSPELRALEASILSQDPSLAPLAARTVVPGDHARPLPSGVVTFLLTDVAGSTRLWERAPDAMAHALARHDAIIRGAVDAHGGMFLKARGEGDSTFSVFRRATDAVAAARAAALALRVEPWPPDAAIAVRAALHTGEALERDGDYYGRAVNRAARLRATAEPGQVLLSRATADLVADHLPDDVRLDDLGARVLRDLDRAETVFALVDRNGPRISTSGATTPAEGPASTPFPARLRSAGSARFVGRAAELDVLERRRKEAAAGEPRVVLIAGEPGIGKTRLAAELALRGHTDGARVVYGRCDAGAGLPYLPWVEAIDQLTDGTPELLASLGGRALGDLGRLVPAVLDRLPDLRAAPAGDPDGDRYRLFSAVTAAVDAAAADSPLVLVLDDLHWADAASLALLHHLVGAVSGKALVIGTYRPSDLTPDHPLTDLLAALRRERIVERVSLSGLADDEVVELVERLAGQTVTGAELDLVHAVRRETDGNPFFAIELLQHLLESGVVTRDAAGRWVVNGDPDDVGLPESVREVVTRRVAHLGDVVQRVLETASVIGRTFSLDVLEGVVEGDPDDLLAALERAEAASLLTSTNVGEFSFSHALVGHALYSGLGPTRRARLHARIAEAMESLGAGDRVNELARHWAAAARPAELGKAIDYAAEAGRRALRALAPADAVRWYSQALDLVEGSVIDDARRCDLLIGLGRAQRHAGVRAFRETLLAAAALAERLGDADRLARAALANSAGMFSESGVVDHERVAALEAALQRYPAEDGVRARLLATLAAELTFDRDAARRRALSDEAVALARLAGDPAVLAMALILRYSAIWGVDTLEERRADIAEARAAAAATRDARLIAWADNFGHLVALEAMDMDEADRLLDRYADAADRLAMPSLRTTALAYRAARALRAGDVAVAAALVDAALAAGRDLGPNEVVAGGAVLLELLRHQHRYADVERVLEDDPSLVPTRDSLTDRARAAYHLGRVDEARRLLDEAMADIDDREIRFQWVPEYSVWGELAALLGATEHAQVLYQVLFPYRDHFSIGAHNILSLTPHALGLLSAALGLEDSVVDEHFAAAVAMGERARSVFHTANAKASWGRVLASRPGEDAARHANDLLREALDAARRFGCAGVEREAADALASLELRPPPLPAPLLTESLFPFVGREAERVRLGEAWQDACAGRRRVVLVTGDAGIGKSRLVREAARAVHDAGGWVLYGRCDEDLAAAYLPFVSILDTLLEHAPEDAVDAHVNRCAADLLPVAARLAARARTAAPAGPPDADAARLRLFEAVRDLVEEVSARVPLLVVIDDLHWADTGTLLLLRYLTVSDPSARLLIVATYRDVDASDELARTLAALWREPGVERLRLPGLSSDEVTAVMESLAGHRTGSSGALLAHAISERTGGNAFFVTELLRHVFETGGATADAAGVWALRTTVDGDDLPGSVRDVVLSRVGRLGTEAETLLTLAAVIGNEFELPVVSDVAGLSEGAALELIERAVAGGLVVETSSGVDRFAFGHGLVVDALVSTISGVRRRRVHARIADVLERRGSGPAEVAAHWAAAGDADRARPWALRAAEEAAASFAYDEAAKWYAATLELAETERALDDADRFELLFQLGRAQRNAGMAEHRQTLLTAAAAAVEAGDVPRLARAALASSSGGLGFVATEVDEERIAVLRAAVDAVGPGDSAIRARLLATLALELPRSAERVALADQALAMSERLADPATILRVLNLRYLVLLGPETLELRLAETARTVQLAIQLGDPVGERWALSWRYIAAMEALELETADRCLARTDELAAALRRPLQWHELFHRANRLRLAGDVARSEAFAAEARRAALATGGDLIAAGDLTYGALLSGRVDDLRKTLETDGEAVLANSLAELALAWCLLGRDADARRVLDRVATQGYSASAIHGYDIGFHAIAAMAAVRLRQLDHAATLYELLLPWADRGAMTGSPVLGIVAHHLGGLARVLGRLAAAQVHLDTAEVAHERIDAGYWLQATRLERAKVLLAIGDHRSQAMDLLGAVAGVAVERGYGELARDAEALLAQPA